MTEILEHEAVISLVSRYVQNMPTNHHEFCACYQGSACDAEKNCNCGFIESGKALAAFKELERQVKGAG